MRQKWSALIVLFLLVFGGLRVIHATDWPIRQTEVTPVTETNIVLTSAPAVVLGSPISSPDATSITTTPVRPRSTRSCPRVAIAPTLSQNGATACLAVILYYQSGSSYSPVCVASVTTFTGSVIPTIDSGRFTTTDGFLIVPTLGCQSYDVRLVAISAGDVTWRSWTLGQDTQASGTASE